MNDLVTDQHQQSSKIVRLQALATKRKQFIWEGYKNIGDYHGGRYDCDFVSPYTKSANNVESQVLIMLQDWASDDFLSESFDEVTSRYGRTPTRETNKQLDKLVCKHLGLSISETFASNLFPFLAPRLVIALGLDCFNGLSRALNIEPSHTIACAIKNPIAFCDSRIWCQAHTSPQGQNMRNRGRIDRVSADWQAMSDWLRNAPAAERSESTHV